MIFGFQLLYFCQSYGLLLLLALFKFLNGLIKVADFLYAISTWCIYYSDYG